MKHIGLFGALQRRRAAQREGFDDVLLLNPDGSISELATSNIGFVRDGRIVWPRSEYLQGTTMALIQQALDEPVVSESLTLPTSLAWKHRSRRTRRRASDRSWLWMTGGGQVSTRSSATCKRCTRTSQPKRCDSRPRGPIRSSVDDQIGGDRWRRFSDGLVFRFGRYARRRGWAPRVRRAPRRQRAHDLEVGGRTGEDSATAGESSCTRHMSRAIRP